MTGAMNAAEVARQLNGKPLANGDYLCSCPVPSHGKGRGDKNPSLTVGDGDKGLVVRCQAGCEQRAVLAAIGYKPLRNGHAAQTNGHSLAGRKAGKAPQRRIVEEYNYQDEHGTLVFQVLRYEPKDFRQRRPHPDKPGEWVWNIQDVRRVPYRLRDLLEAEHDTVLVVEGEKDADTLAAFGFTATTNAGGACKWTADLNHWFKGRTVYIIPDRDEPGAKHAQQVAEHLRQVAASVKIVNLPGTAKDVTAWLEAGNKPDTLAGICEAAPVWMPDVDADEPGPAADVPLTVADWLARDLQAPDFLMGEMLSTTSRALLVAPTGLGKTMFGLTFAAYMAAGVDFLHWRARRKSRVLYIDGEMSRRLLKQRLADVVRRLGVSPEGLFVLSHEDIPNFAPLNTPEGQQQVEAFIAKIGGVDFIVFDNIMSLVGGDQKDEEGWRQTLPWVRDLTRRSIGQLWVHHTGHDETKSYGTKTREWQLDTVMHLEKVERADTDVSFTLSFRKARERTPDNRSDFKDVTVALVDDEWLHDGAAAKPRKGKTSPTARKFLDALTNALASADTTTFQGWRAVTTAVWQAECGTLGLIDRNGPANLARALFYKYRRELVVSGHIACNGELAWKL